MATKATKKNKDSSANLGFEAKLWRTAKAGAVPQDSFFEDVRSILQGARQTAYAAANFIMVEAYWRVGRRIIEEEQGGKARADYGADLVRELARRLGEEFGRGLSVANLWNFRQFFQTFPTEEKLYALRRELTWSHYRLLMRVENLRARQYYIDEAAGQGWSTRALERNIASLAYERLLTRPAAKAALRTAAPHGNPALPAEFIKDPYVLEFLGLPEPSSGASSNAAMFSIFRFKRCVMSSLEQQIKHNLASLRPSVRTGAIP